MAGYSAVTFWTPPPARSFPTISRVLAAQPGASPCCWGAGERLAGAVSTIIGQIPRLAGLPKRPTTGLQPQGEVRAQRRHRLQYAPARSAASALSPMWQSRPDGRSGPRPEVWPGPVPPLARAKQGRGPKDLSAMLVGNLETAAIGEVRSPRVPGEGGCIWPHASGPRWDCIAKNGAAGDPAAPPRHIIARRPLCRRPSSVTALLTPQPHPARRGSRCH